MFAYLKDPSPLIPTEVRSDRFWIQVIIFSTVSSGGWISSWPPLLVFWPLTSIPGTTGWPLVAPVLSRTSRSLFIWMMTLEGTGALGSCSTNSSFGSSCLGFVFSKEEKKRFTSDNHFTKKFQGRERGGGDTIH